MAYQVTLNQMTVDAEPDYGLLIKRHSDFSAAHRQRHDELKPQEKYIRRAKTSRGVGYHGDPEAPHPAVLLHAQAQEAHQAAANKYKRLQQGHKDPWLLPSAQRTSRNASKLTKRAFAAEKRNA